MQKNLRRDFRSAFRNVRERTIITVWRFERAFQRDRFLFRPLSTFQETTLEHAMKAILVSS